MVIIRPSVAGVIIGGTAKLKAAYCNIKKGINGPKCGGEPSKDRGANTNIKPSFAKGNNSD